MKTRKTGSLHFCPVPQICVLRIAVLFFLDTMVFDLVSDNSSLLGCQVNVSAHPGFVLSILRSKDKIQTVESGCWESACNLRAQRYVKLSVTTSLTLGGEYECQLDLRQHLITKKAFNCTLPGNSFTSHRRSCWRFATIIASTSAINNGDMRIAGCAKQRKFKISNTVVFS